MSRKKTGFQFESALSSLEKIITEMESGELTLEDSLEHFEKGINLLKTCQQSLKEAEKKVEILVQKNGTLSLEPFGGGTEIV